MKKSLLYNQDFYGWTLSQAEALARKAISELDWQHLQEEIEALGRQELRELVSRLTVLIGHLLKWELQSEKRSRSWFLTIREQRRAIRRHLGQNPSLKSRSPEALEEGFEAGVDLALKETGLPLRVFPESFTYELEDILRDDFLCNTSQDWEL